MPQRSAPLPSRRSPVTAAGIARLAAEGEAERWAKAIVRARSNQAGTGRVCEGCDEARADDWSHRVGEGVGGLWVPSNGLDLCRPCHRWLHANPDEARIERGWRLESTDDPLLVPALHARWGWVFLADDGGIRPTDITARAVLQT
jgi:hypothetical protein